jgi:hypothetical protein
MRKWTSATRRAANTVAAPSRCGIQGTAQRESDRSWLDNQSQHPPFVAVHCRSLSFSRPRRKNLSYGQFVICYLLFVIVPAAPGATGVLEDSLACLPGKFVVVGQEPDSGRTYRGSVSVRRQGDQLLIEKTVNGELISGTGTIAIEAETPVLKVQYRIESHTIIAGFEFRCGDQNQPRASGWVSPVDGDLSQRNRLGLEVWYYDRAPPAVAPSIRRSADLSKERGSASDDLLNLLRGKFRVIGYVIGSGQVYTGRIVGTPDAGLLSITGRIQGKPTTGELTLSPNRSLVIARYRTGNRMVGAFLNEQTVGDNYPRLCGYFYLIHSSAASAANPRLETWFYDW